MLLSQGSFYSGLCLGKSHVLLADVVGQVGSHGKERVANFAPVKLFVFMSRGDMSIQFIIAAGVPSAVLAHIL